MPTPSEQKALAFVAIVILLGGAVRVVRAGAAAPPAAHEQQALARQALAVDSAATRQTGRNAKRRGSGSKRDTVPRVIGGVASVPPSFARPDRPYSHTPYGSPTERLGYPPPGPRIDVGPGGPRTVSSAAARPSGGQGGGVVDVDVASALEIEVLPRIGPALAKRIVAHRDSFGPYGSLEALGRVKGIGKATLEGLAPRIAFSGKRAAP